MLRYKWSPKEEPSKLKDEELIEKYKFYKFVQKWQQEDRNELLDQIQDLYNEIEKRNIQSSL